eukprot:Lankesteria_metandrocarpae@DN2836_c0_g1_i3.p1
MNFWSSARIAHSEAALPSSQRQAAPRLDLQQTGGAADHTQRMPEAHSMRYHQQHSLPRTADVNVYQTSSYPITTSPLLSQLPAGIGTELLGTTISPAATDDDDAHHHQQQPHQRPTVLSSSCFLWHELPTAGIEVNALLKAVFLDTQQQSVAGQRSTDDNAAVIAPPTTTAVHLPTDTVVMTAARLISGCPSAQYVDSKVDAMECNTVVGCIEDCAVQSKPREESACLNSFISDSTIESASVIDMAVDKNLTTSSPTPMHPNVYSTTDTTSLISSTPNEHVQGGMTTLLSRLLTKSLEIVVRLVDHPLNVTAAPVLRAYIGSSMKAAGKLDDAHEETRWRRLVCIFIRRLVDGRCDLWKDSLIPEVSAFCLESPRIKDAAALFRSLRRMNPPTEENGVSTHAATDDTEIH